jgi:hypothetical protein
MQMKVEIVGKDEFWSNAVLKEWAAQYPERQLIALTAGMFSIENAWLEALKEVAAQCNSQIIVSPSDPSRRLWFRQLLPSFRGTER